MGYSGMSFYSLFWIEIMSYCKNKKYHDNGYSFDQLCEITRIFCNHPSYHAKTMEDILVNIKEYPIYQSIIDIINKKKASELLSLSIGVSDGFFKLEKDADNKTISFINIINNLPFELQTIICNIVSKRNPRSHIPGNSINDAMIKILAS
jgi:hypothetical protein